MLSGKTVKLILYELLQFACLCIPVFVVMERFASVIHIVMSSVTAYWLVVAASVAYVASVTLFVWVPLKYFILKTQRFSEVQVDAGVKCDRFTELPVSLVLFSLICVDIVEKIRPLRLTGQGKRKWAINLSNEMICLSNSTAYLYSSHSYSGPFHFVWIRDPRHDLFVATFMFWFDTVEMVRVARTDSVYYSGWVFPIYILAYLSILRVVITPDSPLLASSSVLFQDLPFLVVRICLLAVFGYVTPVLYILKNIFTAVSFMYFVFMTKLKLLNRGSMF
uniref:Transmembrane protein 236-like n=1 Tax=Sinocyclocheilus anshuiensis TaxID=1608454 RepID=A0A671L1W2_9TELE